MITATKQQAQDRFALLPEQLQDAVFSTKTADVIASIGEQYHLSDDDTETIASLVGWVLLGFLPRENIPEELKTGSILTAPVIKGVADTLAEKIFNPLGPAINAAYTSTPTPSNTSSTPKVIQDIASAKSAVPVPTPGAKAVAPAPLNDLASKGWSRRAPADLPPPVPAPKGPSGFPAAPVPVPTPSAPFSPRTIGGVPVPGHPVGAAPSPAPAPAPVMIQRGENFAAPARNADFHLERKMGAQMDLESVKVQPKARPAMIEFGQTKPAPAPSAPGTIPTPRRTDNYAGFATSLSSVPAATGGERNVTEITAEPKAPPVPVMPQPPMPPKPPVPPQASMGGMAPMPPKPLQTPPQVPPSPPKPPTPKVIVQNFTE